MTSWVMKIDNADCSLCVVLSGYYLVIKLKTVTIHPPTDDHHHLHHGTQCASVLRGGRLPTLSTEQAPWETISWHNRWQFGSFRPGGLHRQQTVRFWAEYDPKSSLHAAEWETLRNRYNVKWMFFISWLTLTITHTWLTKSLEFAGS